MVGMRCFFWDYFGRWRGIKGFYSGGKIGGVNRGKYLGRNGVLEKKIVSNNVKGDK